MRKNLGAKVFFENKVFFFFLKKKKFFQYIFKALKQIL
jgi:hypothetical protein